MSKNFVRLACVALLLATVVGCKATGSGASTSKKRLASGLPAVDSGSPSQSPFSPYPAN